MTNDSVVSKRIQRCQCEACSVFQHASYCAVHNAPALPIGECTCGARERATADENLQLRWMMS